MIGRIAGMASAVAVAGCSVVGIRSVEEPAYTVLDHVGAVEIRHYGPLVAADAVVGGDEIAARGAGFRRVASYIFGGNGTGAKIAMTAPVAQSAEAGRWRIRFFMPSGSSVARLPPPKDANVALIEVPASDMAVLRFTGSTGPEAVAANADRLKALLDTSPWQPAGAVVAWFYDPPWTLPFLRRNEVAAPVARR